MCRICSRAQHSACTLPGRNSSAIILLFILDPSNFKDACCPSIANNQIIKTLPASACWHRLARRAQGQSCTGRTHLASISTLAPPGSQRTRSTSAPAALRNANRGSHSPARASLCSRVFPKASVLLTPPPLPPAAQRSTAADEPKDALMRDSEHHVAQAIQKK